MGIEILKQNKVEDIKGIHLFDGSISNNAMRVRLMLEEKQLQWKSHTVNLMKYEQFEKEYLNINPQGSIPAMIHDGIAVYGSENILKYLEKVFPNRSLSCEKEEEMWEWVESATRTHVETAVGYLYSRNSGRPTRKDMLSVYKEHNFEKYRFLIERGYHMNKTQIQETENINNAKMQMLEDRLSENKFIMGNKVSVADIAWLPDTFFLEYLGFDLSPYPNVIKWRKQMQERPSYNKKSKMPKMVLVIGRHLLKIVSRSKKYYR